MKNILVVFAVLAMASAANAALFISVNGVIDQPDSEITIAPGDTVIIDVYSDGATIGTPVVLWVSGPASYDVSAAVNYYIPGAPPEDFGDGMIFIDLTKPENPIPPITEGTMVDMISLTCLEEGDVVLSLVNETTGLEEDSLMIHQVIPEPITFALLGLGGLFLRRRK